MTGYTVHTGATEKYIAGWDRVFGKTSRAKKGAGPAGAEKSGKPSPRKPKARGSKRSK